MDIAGVVTEILEPYVGRVVADTCVRATALSMGKTADALETRDLPDLETNVRKLLLPIAPRDTVEGLIRQIERRVA